MGLLKNSKFKCSCCGQGGLSLKLMLAIGELGDIIGENHDLYITSGYRCQKHNKAVGGVPGSFHTKSIAADITSPTMDVIDLFAAAQEVEAFRGLGIYPDDNFIHVDLRDGYARFGYWRKAGERIKMSKEELSDFLTH